MVFSGSNLKFSETLKKYALLKITFGFSSCIKNICCAMVFLTVRTHLNQLVHNAVWKNGKDRIYFHDSLQCGRLCSASTYPSVFTFDCFQNLIVVAWIIVHLTYAPNLNMCLQTFSTCSNSNFYNLSIIPSFTNAGTDRGNSPWLYKNVESALIW